MSIKESWHNVGNKILYLRKSNGFTLKQLARKSDLSANTISVVERGKVAPSGKTVCKIAKALGVSPSSLFQNPCDPKDVIHREIVTGFSSDLAERAAGFLSTASQSAVSSPNCPSTDIEAQLASGYSIICICGQVEVYVDGQHYCLIPGDSMTFNSDDFHRWHNSDNSTGIALIVLPPLAIKASKPNSRIDNPLKSKTDKFPHI